MENYIGNYYSKSYIKYALVNNCKNREFACIPKARAFSLKSSTSIDTVLNFVRWREHPVKLYRSVAKLKEIPFFTFNPLLRSKQTHPWFVNEFDKQIYEYDLFFDFDSESASELHLALKDTKDIIEYLEQYEVPYYVIFSGNRGFQVVIDGKYMPEPKLEGRLIQPHKLIEERIKEAFNLKYLDLANNGVPNRLFKVPYSLCPTTDRQPEEEMNVALPLSPEQVENFNLEDIKLKNVFLKINLYNRGILERHSELSDEQKKENVRKLIKSLLIKI